MNFDFAKLRKKLAKHLPAWLKGAQGMCLLFSVGIAAVIILAIKLALDGSRALAISLVFGTCGVLFAANFWFRTRVVNPIIGLGDTARRIAGGSYGAVAEKHEDNEIGALTDAINDMSGKIAEASRVQTEFISSVSHELRTPLTAIAGWSETLLYDEAIEGDSRRGVNIILKESGRLTSMVEELLEFTRIRDGRFTLNVESVDLCAEMEDVVFTYSELLRHENVKLIYSPPEEDLPPIDADPHRIKQVVLNILDNASKYGEGTDIGLSVFQEGDWAKITIRDHGPGISDADMPHVKERFFKGDARGRGSGIGLSVCDEIVTRHGGTLEITNAETGGAFVTVSLPMRARGNSISNEVTNVKKQRN